MNWHAATSEAVLAELGTDPKHGLSASAADQRLARHGPNQLPAPPHDTLLKRFLLQFHNILIYVLLAAAIGTALLGEWIDTGVILGVILINALIGVIQEGKAEKALDSIRAMLSPKAMVRRDGHKQTIDATLVVPGDIILLKAGDRVPADLRLLESHSLRIDEALLTGESVPTEKTTTPVADLADLGDRFCLAFSGTLVTYGRGAGIVIGTGSATEIGKVSGLLSEVQTVITADDTYHVEGAGYVPEGDFLRAGEKIDPQKDHPVLAELLRASLLCNESSLRQKDGRWLLEGEPTEGSLVALGLKSGLDPKQLHDTHPRRATIPFDSAHKFMTTLHEDDNQAFIVMKGAPEAILAACTTQRTRHGDQPLDKLTWGTLMHETARLGQRLLAIAVRPAASDQKSLAPTDVQAGLTLLGLTGIIDPPRDEAITAVAQCQDAGIRVKMITGDHAVTARTIGQALGIGDGKEALSGHELEKITDDHLPAPAQDIDVFARATPEHKLRLVTALQAAGHVVAMTGDGVNDAPALKRADVGIAMGLKGTEAAKEASAMVLADDNFASIAYAVEEGRAVYDNLKKAILFILPTNGGQALTIVAAVLLGLALPLTPVQVLWVNMVIAITLALALAFEAPEPGLMKRRPRDPRTPLLTPLLLWRILFVSTLLVAGTFGQYLFATLQYGTSEEHARTLAINTLVIGQMFYLFNSRFIIAPSWNWRGLFGSRPVLLACAALLVLQALFTYAPPLQTLFQTTALAPAEWLRIFAFGLFVFLAVEIEKFILRRKIGDAGITI